MNHAVKRRASGKNYVYDECWDDKLFIVLMKLHFSIHKHIPLPQQMFVFWANGRKHSIQRCFCQIGNWWEMEYTAPVLPSFVWLWNKLFWCKACFCLCLIYYNTELWKPVMIYTFLLSKKRTQKTVFIFADAVRNI